MKDVGVGTSTRADRWEDIFETEYTKSVKGANMTIYVIP